MFDNKKFSIPQDYKIVGGSEAEGFLTLQSPFGSIYTISLEGDSCQLADSPISPFETNFGSFL